MTDTTDTIETIDDIPTMKATFSEKSWTTMLAIRLLGAMGGLFAITAMFAALVGFLGLVADGDGMELLDGLGTSAIVFLVAAAAFVLRGVTLNVQHRMAGLV